MLLLVSNARVVSAQTRGFELFREKERLEKLENIRRFENKAEKT